MPPNKSELAAEDSAGSDTPEDNPRTASENGEPVLAQQPHGTEKGPSSLNSLLAPSIVDVKIAEPEGTSVVNEAATQISSIQYPKTNEKPEIVKSTTPKPLFEKFRYHFAGFLWSMKGPISLIVLFVITTPIILTSSDLNGPLARLGVTYGFLVLNILAILNNYAIVAATDRAWESLQWGPLLRDGQELTNFLALSTSSGMSGWIRILFTSPGVRHGQTAEDRRKRINKREGNPRMWSSGRY